MYMHVLIENLFQFSLSKMHKEGTKSYHIIDFISFTLEPKRHPTIINIEPNVYPIPLNVSSLSTVKRLIIGDDLFGETGEF